MLAISVYLDVRDGMRAKNKAILMMIGLLIVSNAMFRHTQRHTRPIKGRYVRISDNVYHAVKRAVEQLRNNKFFKYLTRVAQ